MLSAVTCRFSLPRFALAVVLASTSGAFAQDAPPQRSAPIQRQSGGGAAPTTPEMAAWLTKSQQPINLNFPGGTLSDYIAAIQAAAPVPVNVIVAPDLAALKIGPVRLQQAPIGTAIDAMQWAAVAQEGLQIRGRSLDHEGETRSSLNYTVERLIGGNPVISSPRPPAIGVQTFAIGELLEAPAGLQGAKVLKLEDVLQAIEGAIRLPKFGSTPPEILMHKETGLLVVQGSPEQIAVATEIVQQFARMVERSRREAKSRADEQAASAAREHEVQTRLAVAQSAVRDATDRAEKLREELNRLPKPENGTTNELMALSAKLQEAERQREWCATQEQNIRMEIINTAADSQGSPDSTAALRAEVDKLRQEFDALKALLGQKQQR